MSGIFVRKRLQKKELLPRNEKRSRIDAKLWKRVAGQTGNYEHEGHEYRIDEV